MSTKEVIDARPETIGALMTFSSTPETIIVPNYQRFYQWDKSKIIDLSRLTDPDSREFGFIGTMVFVKNKAGSLEVVDGQQRLLSITIMLCGFRDFIRLYVETCEDANANRQLEDMAQDIQRENLLVSKSYSSVQDNPRIEFYRKSYESFNKLFLVNDKNFVPDEPVKSSELKNFQSNYEETISYLKAKYQHHKPADVVGLLNKRIEKLKSLVVNAIYITDPGYAGEVFESINGTGIILKLSELVKNYVFRSAPNPTGVRTSWEQIEANGDNKSEFIESIIKYDWQNRFDESQDFEIFRSIKVNTRDSAGDYLTRLLRVSKIFHFYLHPSVEAFSSLKLTDSNNDKNHIIASANVLRVIGVKQFLRLMIAVDSVRELMSIGEYRKLLRYIQNFQVRAKIAGIQTNVTDPLYSRYGKRVLSIKAKLDERELTSKEAAVALKQTLLFDLPRDMAKQSSDEVFASSFVSYRRTKSTGKDFFKYLLGTIENYQQKQELSIDIKDNNITLEEIYPQEPSEGWRTTDLDLEDVYKIGNATILKGADNGAGSNKVIADKYPIYKSSELKLNKDVVKLIDKSLGRWDKQIILDRGQLLSDIAVKIWTL